MKINSKNIEFITAGSILVSLIIIVFNMLLSGWGELSISLGGYTKIFFLSLLIICLPDVISNWCRENNKSNWYTSIGSITLIILFSLILIGSVDKYSVFMTYLIIFSGILGLFYICRFFSKDYILLLIAVVPSGIFIVTLFYSGGYHSPLFIEKVIIGQAHMDTLFHCSIANIFNSIGYPSAGLNTTPFIHYHFASHILFASLSNILSINIVDFYNIAYPAIFIPLSLKSVFLFSDKLAIFKFKQPVNLLLLLTIIVFLYSTKIFPSPIHPFVSESNLISLMLTFFLFSVFFDLDKFKKPNLSFFLFSFFVLLWICFSKISTGLVVISVISYLYLKLNGFRIKNILILFFVGIVWLLPVIFFVSPLSISSAIRESTLPRMYINLWFLSESFVTYCSGVFFSLIVIFRNEKIKRVIDFWYIFKSNKYIDLELLSLATVVGFILSVISVVTGGSASDVFYFCSAQFFFTIPFFAVYLQSLWSKSESSGQFKTIFLLSTLILSILCRPDIFFGYYTRISAINEVSAKNKYTPNQTLLFKLIKELRQINKTTDKKNTCIYIPLSERWYYRSQVYRKYGSPFIVPAFSGVPLIGGIPDIFFNKKGYSYSDYNNIKPVSDLNHAIKFAGDNGYEKLILFRHKEDNLLKYIISIEKD